MNKLIELTDGDLAGVSGGHAPPPKKTKKVDMPADTIVVFTEGSTITGSPK